MSAAPVPALPAPPAWLQRLLMRASSIIESQWPMTGSFVEFKWREVSFRMGELEETRPEETYRARVEFFPFVVKVYRGRTGVKLCQSVEGNAFEIDRTCWELDGDEE